MEVIKLLQKLKPNEQALWVLNSERKKMTAKRISEILHNKYLLDVPPGDIAHAINPLKGKKVKISKEGKDLFYEIMSPGIIHIEAKNKKIGKEKLIEEIDFTSLQIHPRIKKVSEKLFIDGHYPQSIFDAFKEIEIMVKEKTGLTQQRGKGLMSAVFNTTSPKLKLNSLKTEVEVDEQEGFMHLFMGAMQGVKDPKSHAQILQNDKYKTLEFIQFASLLAKTIDSSQVCK